MTNKYIYRFKKNIYPFRTAVITVFISVVAAVIIAILSQTGKLVINNEMSAMGLNGLAAVIYNRYGENVTDMEFYESIKHLNGLDSATPIITENVSAKFTNGISINTITWGISPDAADIVSLEITSGRMINQTDVNQNAFVCLVDENIAMQTYKRTDICGKTVTVNINGNTLSMKIIGVVKKGSNILNNLTGNIVPDFIYIPYTTMAAFSSKTAFDQIVFTENNSDATDGYILEKLEQRSASYKNKNIILTDLSQQKQQISNIADTAFISLFLVSCVSVIVCSMAVGASVNTAVISRHKDIGIKMSMGASSADIIAEFMISAVAACLIGILSAFLFAFSAVWVVSYFTNIAFVTDYLLIALSISATIILTTVFSFVPSYKAAKLPPIKALNRE